MVTKERVHWIDIAKGVMIIGMVLNHIPNLSNRLGVDLSSFPWGLTLGSAYGVFTMQSFFILSGYTSNFDQSPSLFFLKQIRSLLLPYISFSLICSGVAYLLWDEPFYYQSFGERYFFLVDGYWFLTSLFIAKCLVFLLHRMSKSKVIELVGSIVLLVIGIAISEFYSDMEEPSHYHNWFHYRNGLCMTVFITIGYLLKKYQIVEKYGGKIGIIYCVTYCITYPMPHFHIPFAKYLAAPFYTHYFSPSLAEINGFLIIPSYLFYTITGSIMIFWMCQKIGKLSWMEYLGQESLIIYCVHFTFLKIYINTFSFLQTDGLFKASFFFILIAFFSILSSTIIAKVFKYKPFQYLVGK